MIRRHALLLAPVLALLLGGTATAQVGALDQPFRNDPFQPLLRGGWSFTHYLGVGAENNTLGIGDVVALYYIQDDFRPTDIFLVAGLVPAGEGIRFGTHDRTGITMTFPVGRYVTLGLLGGVRVLGSGQVPDDIAALIRDGNSGDEVTVNLTELGGEAFAYAEGGLSGVADVPLLPTPFGELRLLAGAGARYVHSLSHVRMGFAGDTGEDSSTFVLTRTGISTSLNMAAPLGEEFLSEGGGGIAVDIMAGAALGEMAQLRLSVTDIGSADVTVAERGITSIVMNDVSFLELGSAADTVIATDTLPGEIRSVALPTTFRADATFRPIRMVGLGVRLAVPLNEGAPILEPLYQAGVELRLLRPLPVRLGITGGGDFGTGLFAGFGLDTRAVGFDLEVGSAGGPVLADIRGLSFRSALSIRF